MTNERPNDLLMAYGPFREIWDEVVKEREEPLKHWLGRYSQSVRPSVASIGRRRRRILRAGRKA
jgi:hypothetical protein